MHMNLKIAACAVLMGTLFAVSASAADVAGLIKATEASDPSARLAAISQLGLVGAGHPEAVTTLASLLKDESSAVRAHAVEALGEIGQPALAVTPAIVELLADTDPVVCREAIDAIRKIRPGAQVTLPLLVKVLQGADDAARIRAIAALADLGKAAVPGLIEALDHSQGKYWACLVISEIGPDASEAVPALTKLLSDEMPDVRRETILALAAIGPASASAVPQLAAALNNKLDQTVATYALGRIGGVPDDVQAKIRQNLTGEDRVLAAVSHWTLAKLHPEDENHVRQTVDILAEQLKNKQRRIRSAAAQLLVDLNPPPSISQPILEKVVEGADAETLDAVLDALASQGERVLPRLIQALQRKEVRFRAAAIVARIGPKAKPAVPALIEALQDDNAATRNEVLFALAAIGPEAQAAATAVIRALNDEDAKVRYGACYALGKMGPPAIDAKAALQKCLDSDDEFLAMASAWALAQIAPACPVTARKSVPLLVKALGDSEAITRVHAAETLGFLGPQAKSAVPALKTASKDRDEAVRAAASAALEQIGQ